MQIIMHDHQLEHSIYEIRHYKGVEGNCSLKVVFLFGFLKIEGDTVCLPY